jgi:hypothetical protein
MLLLAAWVGVGVRNPRSGRLSHVGPILVALATLLAALAFAAPAVAQGTSPSGTASTTSMTSTSTSSGDPVLDRAPNLGLSTEGIPPFVWFLLVVGLVCLVGLGFLAYILARRQL